MRDGNIVVKSAIATYYRWAGKVTESCADLVRAKEGEGRIDGIVIAGNVRFRQQVAESILQLKQNHSFGYSLVQRYIRAIVAYNKPVSFGFVSRLAFDVPASDGGLGSPEN